jgi:hypothetical protein
MKRHIFIYSGLILFLISCYPEGPEYTEDLDIVYTNYDTEYNFSGSGTYSMPDRIVKITGDLIEGKDPEFVKEPYATQMLQTMEENMSDLGWTRTEDPANADIVLFPAVWTNTTIYYWYDYWCWYYPYYCGWGWGWYYPSVSSLTTGTLVMTMIADGDEYVEPVRVWTAAANGIVSGAYNTTRVTRAIDQAFEQSPYLNIR